MALIKCPECGKETSDKEKNCIHCGKIGKKNKKIILILTVIVLFIIIGLVIYITSDTQLTNNIDSITVSENVVDKSEFDTTDDVISEMEENVIETTQEENIVERENCDFRNSYWGDSHKDVITYEGSDFISSETGVLTYERTVSGYDVYATFLFNQNSLYYCLYKFMEKHTFGSQYIIQFNNIKDTLLLKYGEPYEDSIIPIEKDSQISMAGESKALEYGYVCYRTQWEVNGTNICLIMVALNDNIEILITYTDNNSIKNTEGL